MVEVQCFVMDKYGPSSRSMDLQRMTCNLDLGDYVGEMEACRWSPVLSPI